MNVTLPRIGIALTQNGAPISAEWYRWAHDLTVRGGGVTGVSTAELEAMISGLSDEVAVVVDEAQAASTAASRSLAILRKPQEAPISADVVRQLVYRLAALERRVRAIEESPI